MKNELEFITRFAGRGIIVHAGLPPGWLARLLEQPGGGGYFRLHAGAAMPARATAIEYVAHRWVLPLALPLPVFVQVDAQVAWLRHLTRGGRVIDAAEVLGLVSEIASRHHVALRLCENGFEIVRGMAVADNEVEYL